ncbi:MAG TPA: hypothetical protein VE011_09900 [Candidatus Dormibacteraeota bacterium]|nr:hypothetical protein [Candidatus Dormibacteraeota bacterium]
MLDPEAGLPDMPGADPAPRPAPARQPAYLPFAAYRVPEPPLAPTWTRAYDLPSARRVVSAGLQLAVDASTAIRRGSIYIGLLSLGAFGPAVVLVLLGLGRLLSDPGTAEMLQKDPTLIFFEQPDLLRPLLLVYGLAIGGIVLLLAIGIDAQAIAISLLAGRASERPLHLWEAIIRARQVFWRLLGAGSLVWLASYVVSLLVVLPFFSLENPNTGIAFIGSALGALVVTPFAFASTSIVLGDVGAVEALRRSWRLFRVRPRIALAVTIFTLVTSAIQQFALSAGLDAADRVGTFMHLGFGGGGAGQLLASILVLAFVVAFGSLTFTIAAIVAAPQVAGFLGLTYYSAGLDHARSATGVRPRRFRWVSLPMAVAMIGLLIVAGIELPSIVGFQLRKASPLLGIVSAAAQDNGVALSPEGESVTVDDPASDGVGRSLPSIDITSAGYAVLPEVPNWLLDSLFDCAAKTVTCPDPGMAATRWSDGAYLFIERTAGPPAALQGNERQEWGPMLALPGFPRAPSDEADGYGGASHAFITRDAPDGRTLVDRVYAAGRWIDYPSHGRSAWIGNDLLTLVPISQDLPADPVQWDAHAADDLPPASASHDELRSSAQLPLLPIAAPPVYYFSSFK